MNKLSRVSNKQRLRGYQMKKGSPVNSQTSIEQGVRGLKCTREVSPVNSQTTIEQGVRGLKCTREVSPQQ